MVLKIQVQVILNKLLIFLESYVILELSFLVNIYLEGNLIVSHFNLNKDLLE